MNRSEAARKELIAGNERFAAGQMRHPHDSPVRRHELLAGQHPIAAVLGCADSRIVPEFIFDLGLGDLFVIRVAGEVLDMSVLGSLEYAVAHLDVPLVVVLGHSHCGAVTEACRGNEEEGALRELLAAITPVCNRADDRVDPVPLAIECQARMVAREMVARSPAIAAAVDRETTRVMAAIYDQATGRVAWLDKQEQ